MNLLDELFHGNLSVVFLSPGGGQLDFKAKYSENNYLFPFQSYP